MVGMADNGTLILRLYPLEKNVLSGDDQKEKMVEMDQGDGIAEDSQKGRQFEVMQVGDGNQDESSEDILGQSEVLITYIDRKFAFVVLQASPQDFLQLIGVDDPKWDRGEVIKVYDEGYVQLRLIDGVSVNNLSQLFLLHTVTQESHMLPLNHLQCIDAGYCKYQHPTVGKEVIIWARKSPCWGHVGTAKNHNPILNTFQVAFSMMIMTLYAQELWLK